MRRVFEKTKPKEAQIPKLSTKGSKKPKMRPSFSTSEINDVLMPYMKRYVKVTGGRRKNREFRLLLYGMVNFALLGGLRPPLAISNLRWNQISIKKTLDGKLQYVSIAVRGKTGKRDSIINQALIDVLNQLKDINPAPASKKIKNIIGTDDSLIFTYSDGTQPYNWAGGFIIEAGFNVFKLAVQAGTSVSVIDNFNNKALPDKYAEELVGVANNKIDMTKALGKKFLDDEVDDTLEKVFLF